MKKECVLYNRECINCGECDICDLDPKKICDNCGACLETDDDYSTVDVDLTFEDGDRGPELLSYEELFPEKAFIGENADDDRDDEFYDQDFEEDFGDEFDGVEYDDYDEFTDDEDDDLGSDFGDLFV